MLQRTIEIVSSQTDCRVLLEPLTKANVDEVVGTLLPPDELANKWLIKNDAKFLQSPDTYEDYLSKPDQQKAWAIRIGETAVGISHLWNLDTEYPGVSTFITRYRNLGKGIGTMARVGLISSHVFVPQSNTEFVQTATLQGNVPATRSLEKAGFYITDYATDESGGYLWQDVDGEPNCIPRWIVVNPDQSPAKNEYAGTPSGQESQMKFASYVQNLRITVL